MKLDILKTSWLDIVFEGRNQAYGAYELRKKNPKTTAIAMILGAFVFVLALSTPKIMALIESATAKEETTLDEKIVTIKLPPKKVEEIKNLPPPPPPPPKVDQVKFVKPVVAKTEEVTEAVAKIDDMKDKDISDANREGDKDAERQFEKPVGDGPTKPVEDDNVYNMAVISVKPEFPGGIDKFYKYVGSKFQVPEVDGLKGRIFVQFVVEKDGSLTDIKVLKDIGHGTDKEAIRVLKNCPKWAPGENNGKKIRVQYQLPITIQAAAE